MAIYTYTNKDINKEAICQAFTFGSPDSVFNIKPEVSGNDLTGLYTIDVETTDPKVLIDGLIASGENGDLFYSKTEKIQEISRNTINLENIGVQCWSGAYIALDEKVADKLYTAYLYFSNNPSYISATYPYMVETIDGRGALTTDVNDIHTLSNDCANRLLYLYTSTLNGDGSKGKAALIQEINACTTIQQVEAITDTRA